MPRTVTRRRSTCSKRIRPCAQVCARCLGTRPFPALPSRAPAAQNVCNYLLFAFTFCHNFFSVSAQLTKQVVTKDDCITRSKLDRAVTKSHHQNNSLHHTTPRHTTLLRNSAVFIRDGAGTCFCRCPHAFLPSTHNNVVERRRTSSNVVERRRTSSNVVERRRTTTKKTQSSWRRSESFVVLRFLISLCTVWLHTTYTKSHYLLLTLPIN